MGTRVVTGILLISVLALLVFLAKLLDSPWPFVALVGAFLARGGGELACLVSAGVLRGANGGADGGAVSEGDEERPFPRLQWHHCWYGILWVFLMFLAVVVAPWLGWESTVIALGMVGAPVGICFLLILRYAQGASASALVADLLSAFAAVVWLLIPVLFAVLALMSSWEFFPLVFALAVVVFGDTGAYFSGRALGSRKLAPRLSPNKTVEGAVGGLVSSVVGAVIVSQFAPVAVSWIMVVMLALVAGVLGQIGDLAESGLKRWSGYKDSGAFLPGHGGALDRVDSLLFVLPLVCCSFLLGLMSA